MQTFDSTKINYILRVPTDKDKDTLYQLLGGAGIDHLDLKRYTERLAYGLYRIRKLFEEHDVTQFDWGADQSWFYKAAESACDTVFNAYKLALAGRREEALALLYSYYFSKGLIEQFIEEVHKETKFYRLRPSDDYRLFSNEEMFHLPFEKCQRTSNYRFSISGLPILYFGSSMYGCWMEANQPDIEKANVALYQIDSKACVKCLPLIMPQKRDKVTKERIKLLPLILASTMKVHQPNEPFRPEYVIPQLLTECVLKYNAEHNPDYILGIKYLSTKRYSEGNYHSGEKYSYLYENYAFPPIEHSFYGVCPRLSKCFSLIRISSIFQDTHLRPQKIEMKDENEPRDEYQNSSFRKLERWLATPQMPYY